MSNIIFSCTLIFTLLRDHYLTLSETIILSSTCRVLRDKFIKDNMYWFRFYAIYLTPTKLLISRIHSAPFRVRCLYRPRSKDPESDIQRNEPPYTRLNFRTRKTLNFCHAILSIAEINNIKMEAKRTILTQELINYFENDIFLRDVLNQLNAIKKVWPSSMEFILEEEKSFCSNINHFTYQFDYSKFNPEENYFSAALTIYQLNRCGVNPNNLIS